MVIIGTGGLAKDIVGSLARDYRRERFYFYNDRTDFTDELFVNRYPVIRSEEELKLHFKENGNLFVSAIANTLLRYKMNEKIKRIGGSLTSLVALKENVSEFGTIGKGVIIQPDVVVSSCVSIEEGSFLNCGTIIGHDVKIGRYCSFGPGVRILGGVEIGEFSYIGTNAVILPGVKIGKKVRIGIGKIIEHDVPDNSKIM